MIVTWFVATTVTVASIISPETIVVEVPSESLGKPPPAEDPAVTATRM